MKFSYETFQNIWLAQGPDKAFKYRDQFNTKIESTNNVENKEPEMVSVDELTIEDMRKILDGAEIKYSHLAKEKGLMKLIQENNLI